MTLVEFLLARIVEDEERARRAASVEGADFMLAALPLDVFDGLRPGFPNRVLAECAAKRRIVALHEHDLSGTYGSIPGCWCCDDDRDYGLIPAGWCETLRALAVVYADHPDYRPEWSPS